MATYEEISATWFPLRFKKECGSFEAFERESAQDDRQASKVLIERMSFEAPRTARAVFGLDDFGEGLESIEILDAHLSPAFADSWMRNSDPCDPNNHFKLTLSEFSAHYGEVMVRILGGGWNFARMPNYFESKVVVGDYLFNVFDALMKRCSDDYSETELCVKLVAFARHIERRDSSKSFGL